MRILVTGAGGYLGSKIVDNLLHKGFDVIPVDRARCNLLDRAQVKELIQSTNPDRVVHCAAIVPKTIEEYGNIRHELSFTMLDNILKESKCPIIYISSMTAKNPTTEYATYKLRGELHLQMDGRAGLSIRIPGLFGLPRRNGLIYNMLQSIKNKSEFYLSGVLTEWTGIHVDRAAEAIANHAIAKLDNYMLIIIEHTVLTRQFMESIIQFGGEI